MSIEVNIKKKFSKFNLDVNFKAENESVALLGASGCGKSLTLKCIAGIVEPDEGFIKLNDRILFDSQRKINITTQKRNVGMMFQNYALIPTMTVEENISMGVRKVKKEKEFIISTMLSIFRIEHLRNYYPSQISGGQQQRVALARMFASEPEILMLDEPFSALDSYLRWQLEQELYDVMDKFKSKGEILYVSHNRNEVYRLCDKIVVINDGSISEILGKNELFKSPKTYSSALLTGCKNISEAEIINSNTIYAKSWGIDFKLTKKIPKNVKYIGLRAHYMKLCPEPFTLNSYKYKFIKEIEEPFESVILVKTDLFDETDGLIRVTLPKQQRKLMEKLPQYLCIDERDILLLT